MFYLGIDIGKSFHVASLIDEKKNVIFKGFHFKNTTDDANLLLEKIAPYPEIEIGMEYSETSLASEEILEIRNLLRFRISLVDSIGDLKRKTVCVLDQIFPEYESVFSDVFGKTSKEILNIFTSPADFENISAEKLNFLLEKVTKKHFARNKLNQLSNLAKNSFGISLGIESLKFQLQLLISQMSFIEGQVVDVEQKISELLEKLNSPITTVPGIGKVIGATILGEIGDIKRFSTPAKLVAYAGLDSKTEQSGSSQDFGGKMTRACW